MRPCLFMLIAGLACGSSADLHGAGVGLIQVKGAIGPATSSYIARAVEVAAERKDKCLVIELDTPGGSLDATKEIVQTFYASPLPTVILA